jgi:SAM-dependent methyltransferase
MTTLEKTYSVAARVLRREWRRAGRKARMGLRALYYRHLFDRPGSFARMASEIVGAWEQRDGRGDIPVASADWDRQYAAGSWEFMAEAGEWMRYSTLIGLLAAHKPGGSVLDVGCGAGLLFQRYKAYGYTRFVGVDISAAAIARLAAEQDERTRFVCADAEQFVPDGQFDAILFNETLYYLHEPFVSVERYSRFLAPTGILLVSTFAASPRAVAILRGLKRRWRQLDEVTTSRVGKEYRCTVFAAEPFGRT